MRRNDIRLLTTNIFSTVNESNLFSAHDTAKHGLKVLHDLGMMQCLNISIVELEIS